MGGMDARPRGYLSQELYFVFFQHEKGLKQEAHITRDLKLHNPTADMKIYRVFSWYE